MFRDSIWELDDLHRHLLEACRQGERVGPVFTMVDVAQMNRIGSIGIVICQIFGLLAHGLEQLKAFEKEINDMWTRIPDGSGYQMSVFLFREKQNEKQDKSAFAEPSELPPADTVYSDKWIIQPKGDFERNQVYAHETLKQLAESFKKVPRLLDALILTRSSMMGKLSANSQEEQPIYVNYKKFPDDFTEQHHRSRLLLSSNTFVPDQDCPMKCVTTKFKWQLVNNDLFIIYRLPNNDIVEDLCPSRDWPLFGIEDVSVSPLSHISLSDIVEC
jgi:hypothetical protein